MLKIGHIFKNQSFVNKSWSPRPIFIKAKEMTNIPLENNFENQNHAILQEVLNDFGMSDDDLNTGKIMVSTKYTNAQLGKKY